MSVKVKLIIPAAGYGTRVGSPVAKELMPAENDQPLIQWWLEKAHAIEAEVHLITRKEKAVLADYVQSFCRELNIANSVQWIESSKEWPDTVLQAQSFWGEKNILVLPDTRFEPQSALIEIAEKLGEFEVVPALFDVQDPTKWGIVRQHNGQYQICDKPLDIQSGEVSKAWGILGFRKQVGAELFEGILNSYFDKKWKVIPGKIKPVDLKQFADLTR